MATITGITIGGSTTTAPTTGTATRAWPLWYSTANTTANSTTGAWINVTCGTWNGGLIRATWVNGYLCLTTTSGATTITTASDQMVEFTCSPEQYAALQRALAKRMREAEVHRRRQERERTRAAREWEHAVRRAERLLIRHLNRGQRMMYRSERRFVVVSRDRQRMYEITYGHAHNVFVLENGDRVREMCVVPRSIGCPIPDVMLAQKLWIEHMEADMVARANIWDVRDGRHRQIHHGTGPQVVAA